MKLNAFDLQLFVAQSHDYVVSGVGRYFETVRQTLTFDDQRVVATSRKMIVDPSKYCFPVMTDLGSFSVHQLWSTNYAAPKSLTNRLVAETNTEQRNLPGKTLDGF